MFFMQFFFILNIIQGTLFLLLYTDTYTGPPELFLNPVSEVQVTAGQTLTFTCYITGVAISNYELRWLKDNNSILVDGVVIDKNIIGKHTLQVDKATISHSGSYACEVVLGNETHCSPATEVAVTGKPDVAVSNFDLSS